MKCGVRKVPHDRDVDPMFVHECQLLRPIPILYTKAEIKSTSVRRSGTKKRSWRVEKYLRTDWPSSGGLIIQDHQPVFLKTRFARNRPREDPWSDGPRAQERSIAW